MRENVPTRVGTSSSWAKVFAGIDSICAIQTDGSLWCWGSNDYGELGDGTTTGQPVPELVSPGTRWASVSISYHSVCGIQTDGSLWCWGENDHGELGDGTTAEQHLPERIGASTSWASVTCGLAFACGTQVDGSLWCWGDDCVGELGDGVSCACFPTEPTNCHAYAPEQIATSASWKTVAGSPYSQHACAIQADSSLWCWGYDGFNALGDGTANQSLSRNAPERITTATWNTITAGGNNTCGIASDGSRWCWGNDAIGQLGDGTTTAALQPEQIGATNTWVTVTMGYEHGCGVLHDGTLLCWGGNPSGQLGDGTTTTHLSPEVIAHP
jgi:alpha-tubulin suppressor-like RCC1 family protein